MAYEYEDEILTSFIDQEEEMPEEEKEETEEKEKEETEEELE
jgi:hypothetical protein